MKVRVVYKADKSVSVIHPAPRSRRPNETEDEWLERVFSMAMVGELNGLPYDDVETSELPVDRRDRNAWEGEKGKGISVNYTKAQQLRKEVEEEEKILEKLREMAIKELEREGEF